MKIVFLARRFYPDVGGVEKHVYEISRRLFEKGNEVIVITESLGREDEIDGIKIIRINNKREDWFKKFYIWKWMLKNISLFYSADIIHIHDIYYAYLPVRFLLFWKKSFITFHGYETFPIRRKSIIIRKASEKLSTGNMIVGDFMKKWYGVNPDFVIYGAVEIPKEKTTVIKKDSAIFLGRLDEHTGILEYAESVRSLKSKYPKFKFIIYGEGKYFNKLKDFNLNKFHSNAHKKIAENNFAFASRYLFILEALANKKFVIAHYDNKIKEDYLKMSPFSKFIFIENSAEGITDKILSVFENPNSYTKNIEKGFEFAKEQSWENLISKYEKLWSKK